jgi:hypothetical protein
MKRLVLLFLMVFVAAARADEPAKVSLDVKAATLREAVGQFMQQTGFFLRCADERAGQLSIQFADKPRLEALGEFMSKASATFSPDTATPELQIIPAPAPLQWRKVDDKLLMLIDRITVQGQQSLAPGQSMNVTYTVSGFIVPDASLGIVALNPEPRIVERQDEQGIRGNTRGMRPFNTISPRPTNAFPFTIQFNADKRLDKINMLRARIVVWQAMEFATAKFTPDNLIDATSVTDNGVTVASSVTVEPEGKRVIKLTLGGTPIEQYLKEPGDRGFVRSLFIRPPQGLLELNVAAQRRQKKIELTIFSAEQPKAILADTEAIQIRLPLKVRQIELPITLRDLPLPN